MIIQRKAVALISGGLDSMLAAKMILDQGIHVEGINFFTGFCVTGHTHAIRNPDKKKPRRNDAFWVAEQLGIKLHLIDIAEEYKKVVLSPKHGYGQFLNPCVDCKIFMLQKADVWRIEHSFDFIITGEVVGQRPKSQGRRAMELIARESTLHDRLLRPLSAKYFMPSLPEREGWVDREKLGDIYGRGRTKQIQMAKAFGYADYAQPAGGCCFLTDKYYTNKLRDLWQHRGEKDYSIDDIVLLKVGRHLRLHANFKLIIARDEGENNFLKAHAEQRPHLKVLSHEGPIALWEGNADSVDLEMAAKIVARFSQGKSADCVQVEIVTHQVPAYIMAVRPAEPNDIKNEWYV